MMVPIFVWIVIIVSIIYMMVFLIGKFFFENPTSKTPNSDILVFRFHKNDKLPDFIVDKLAQIPQVIERLKIS